MKRILTMLFCWSLAVGGIAFALSVSGPQIISNFAPESSTAAYLKFNTVFTGDWMQYGQVFTHWQVTLFRRIFLLVLTIVPTAFLLHFLVMGAKKFSHEGKQVYFFNLFNRFIHWLTAASIVVLVLTGLMMVFGYYLGGGPLVRTARSVHLLVAISAATGAFFMFFMWVKDMFPAVYDIAWVFMMGGYLSKEKKPIPAGKFNAGQKVWFWLATLGSSVMAVSGYFLYAFQSPRDDLRIMVITHNLLASLILAFLILHIYMGTMAIKGSLWSMITGYKPREEIEILHSRYKIKDS